MTRTLLLRLGASLGVAALLALAWFGWRAGGIALLQLGVGVC
ncbi:hypothetical protein [Pseudomonas sp. UBA6310]|nr:hypothetical protein [Pseudomonas sp. UBA6310]